RRIRAKRWVLRIRGLGRLCRHQRVGALGLALESKPHRKGLNQREPEVEQGGRWPGLQFELDLRRRRPPLAGEQKPLVEGDLDRRPVRFDGPGGAADVGAEPRRERLVARDVRNLARGRLVEQRKVQIAGWRSDFRLLALEGAPVFCGGAFEAHDPAVSRAAYAERDAGAGEVAL